MTTEERDKLIRFIEGFQAELDAAGIERQAKQGQSLLQDDYVNGAGVMAIRIKKFIMAMTETESSEWLSIKDAAALKGRSEQSIRDILRDAERSQQIFPSAQREGSRERGEWKLLKAEVEAWKPRAISLPTKAEAQSMYNLIVSNSQESD
jgi:hypothetical protein